MASHRIMGGGASNTSKRELYGVNPSDFLACMPANYHPFKDHVTLIKAWATVIGRLGETEEAPRLICVGRGFDQAYELKALCYECGLKPEHVRFGLEKDVKSLLSECDLLVFSSQYEGCPNAVLEGMQQGLPVVGTDIPGIREALGCEQQKWLAAPEDAENLAFLIMQMLSLSSAERQSIGNENRLRVKQYFSVDDLLNQTESFLLRIL